jgi:hypothetical protein
LQDPHGLLNGQQPLPPDTFLQFNSMHGASATMAGGELSGIGMLANNIMMSQETD